VARRRCVRVRCGWERGDARWRRDGCPCVSSTHTSPTTAAATSWLRLRLRQCGHGRWELTGVAVTFSARRTKRVRRCHGGRRLTVTLRGSNPTVAAPRHGRVEVWGDTPVRSRSVAIRECPHRWRARHAGRLGSGVSSAWRQWQR